MWCASYTSVFSEKGKVSFVKVFMNDPNIVDYLNKGVKQNEEFQKEQGGTPIEPRRKHIQSRR